MFFKRQGYLPPCTNLIAKSGGGQGPPALIVGWLFQPEKSERRLLKVCIGTGGAPRLWARIHGHDLESAVELHQSSQLETLERVPLGHDSRPVAPNSDTAKTLGRLMIGSPDGAEHRLIARTSNQLSPFDPRIRSVMERAMVAKSLRVLPEYCCF